MGMGPKLPVAHPRPIQMWEPPRGINFNDMDTGEFETFNFKDREQRTFASVLFREFFITQITKLPCLLQYLLVPFEG